MSHKCQLLKLSSSLLISVFTIQVVAGIASIKELDEAALFSFSVMSDNRSKAPNSGDADEKREMTQLDDWATAHDEFVLGLGDHTKGGAAGFLKWISTDPYWKKNFYPNVGDGECAYWGYGQGDWGAGWEIFKHVDDFFARDNVEFRSDDKVDYYAFFEVGKITVHVISLHYSDGAALKEASREFMQDVLEELKETKTKNDIIVVLAHNGNWVNKAKLSSARKKLLFNTADLIFGASSHMFRRYSEFDKSYPDGALFYNSGATITGGSTHGYIQVHVLPNPTRVTVQYINLEQETTRKLHDGAIKKSGWDNPEDLKPAVKTIGGGWELVDWSRLETGETSLFDQTKQANSFKESDLLLSSNTKANHKTIQFSMKNRAHVSLKLFNSKGKLLKNVYDGMAKPGTHTMELNTGKYPSGIYYLHSDSGINKLVKIFTILH